MMKAMVNSKTVKANGTTDLFIIYLSSLWNSHRNEALDFGKWRENIWTILYWKVSNVNCQKWQRIHFYGDYESSKILWKRGERRIRSRAPALDRIRRRLACIGESSDGEGLAAFRAILFKSFLQTGERSASRYSR